jgi:S1-C subfamily serine protease
MKPFTIIPLVLVAVLALAVIILHLPSDEAPERLVMLDEAKSKTVMVITVMNPKYPDYIKGGSGAIISEDGYIVTNEHVIEKGQEFYVVMNEHDIYEAELIGDFEEGDLAVLKVEASDLPFFEFNQDELQPGQNVFAIGSPFFLEQSISSGILSALKRYSEHTPMTYYLQSNVACNPGNSGGPLVDDYGKLIGINSWVISHNIEDNNVPNPSICFSVPDRVVEYVAQKLQSGNKLQEKWIGATFKNVDYNVSLKAGFNKVVGVMANMVYPESPAEKSGLQKGDIIIDFNGEEINSVYELNAEVNLVPVDMPVPAVVWRNEETIEMEISSELMFPDEEAQEEESTPEDAPAEEGMPADEGESAEDEATDDEAADGEATDGEASDEEASEDEDDSAEQAEDEAAQPEPTSDEVDEAA